VRNIPRILPLAGVAVGGVLALHALSGARALPDLFAGGRAFAEDAAKPGAAQKADKNPKPKAEKAKPVEGVAEAAATGESKDAVALPAFAAPGPKPAPICAPTAAELAKEAGLSPAELQVLQSLGARRGQLDLREQQLDVQLALLTAAEAKLDAKVRALNGLKTDIKGLLAQADSREQGELDRLVKVFEGMKAKDAAPRMVLLDDSVRLPIAAKMKERSLSAILAVMPAAEAKKLTEALARRFTAAKTLAQNATAQAAAAPAAAAAADAAPAKPKAAPKKAAQAKAPAKKPAPAQAANDAPQLSDQDGASPPAGKAG